LVTIGAAGIQFLPGVGISFSPCPNWLWAQTNLYNGKSAEV